MLKKEFDLYEFIKNIQQMEAQDETLLIIGAKNGERLELVRAQ
jgi:hypothetical protein